MTESKITFVVTGDGFYREHDTMEECLHWADYYGKQGKRNIQVTKMTVIREALFRDDQTTKEEAPAEEQKCSMCGNWLPMEPVRRRRTVIDHQVVVRWLSVCPVCLKCTFCMGTGKLKEPLVSQ